jgi:hypothetical protein
MRGRDRLAQVRDRHGGGRGLEAPGSVGARDVVASAPLHAEPPGLYIQDAKGSAQAVSSEAIARTFGACCL